MSSSFHPCRSLCVFRAVLPALAGAIAVLAFAAPFPVHAAALSVIGGDGADGSSSGSGADGSDATPAANSGGTFDSITVIGGNGGNGGDGNRGGKGGNASQSMTGTTVSTGAILVRGGTGGDTGTTTVSGVTVISAGDEGGDATLTFDAGTTVTSSGPVSVISGTDGSNGSWSGVPRLSVSGTLIAPSVTVDNSTNGGMSGSISIPWTSAVRIRR